MLALMTQSFLDIGFGIIWWTTIQTGTALGHGFRYLWNLNSQEDIDDEEENDLDKNVINMSDFKEILEENNRKIKELSDKLDSIKEI